MKMTQCLVNKPLGGFSCASWDKNIVNLQRCQSVESITWNSMPSRDKPERINKFGVGFSKILNSIKSETRVLGSSYKTRVRKLGEISESISEYNHSKIDDKTDLSKSHLK